MRWNFWQTTKPTAAKAIDALVQAGILQEITGKRRDRVYAYRAYLATLSEELDATGIVSSAATAATARSTPANCS